MVALQLLVPLIVLVTSDGALSNGNLQCAYKEGNFCSHAKRAYQHNENAIRELVDSTFKNNKESLSNTNNAIADVLKVKNKSELFERLREPMRQEVSALSELMDSCIVEGREVPQCGDVLVKVSFATYELAKATIEAAEGDQKEAIKNACDKFKKDVYTEDLNKSLFELAYELGTTVVKEHETTDIRYLKGRGSPIPHNTDHFGPSRSKRQQLFSIECFISKVIKMIVLQLLVALVVLNTADGTLSIGKITCVFKWESLCEHLMVGYHDNEDAILDLREGKYKEDKERLQKTNRELSNLLKLKPENKSELLEPLHRILDLDVNALFQLRVSCNAGTSNVLTIYCEDALYFAALATSDLVQAIMEVAEESQLQEIKKAYENFETKIHDETHTPSGLAHTMGMHVVRVLAQQK